MLIVQAWKKFLDNLFIKEFLYLERVSSINDGYLGVFVVNDARRFQLQGCSS